MSSFSLSRLFISVAMVAIAGCSGAVTVDGPGEEADDGTGAVAPSEPGLHPSEFAGNVGAPSSSVTSCAHDLCSIGEALATGCDPCVDQICAVDSFCCQGAWDSICREEVGSICGQPCPITCGNGMCEAGEDCSTCSQDCGACPTCGDSICQGVEDCSTCSQDCGACPVCGDGTCDWPEDCLTCSQDCGACPTCGDGTCNWFESCSTCSQDCGACPVPVCGDAICDWTEDCSTCSQDCGACPTCGDGSCHWSEDCSTCSQDCGACPVCGDGTCDWSESCSTCSQDCGACPTCGDGTCDSTETCGTCTQDCGACVCHDKCVDGTPLGASCGQCEAQICAVDPFCCQIAWDFLCMNEVASVCGETCP